MMRPSPLTRFGLWIASLGAKAQGLGSIQTSHLPPADFLAGAEEYGARLSPELMLVLSAMYCGITMISQDIASMPCQFFRYAGEGKERVRPGGPGDAQGIAALVYRLRWQPNTTQTAVEFWRAIIVSYLLRDLAYARIVPGPSGFADQLLTLHPDRVRPERAPSGGLRYRISHHETLTADELLIVRGLSFDGGRTVTSRADAAFRSIAAGLGIEQAAANFFRHGFAASMLATYTGEKSEEQEAQLHASISRYATGARNAFGLLVVNEELKFQPLGVEPQKSQLIEQREFVVREVARWLQIPGHKLEAQMQTQAYAAREAANLEYVMSTLRPTVVTLEQSIQRDLIPDELKGEYFAEFLIDALLRGDTTARAAYYRTAIQFGWMTRNEVRLRENLNPADGLDRFLEPLNMGGVGDDADAADRADRRDGLRRAHARALAEEAEYV